jgi:pathogenesis-related protein 1
LFEFVCLQGLKGIAMPDVCISGEVCSIHFERRFHERPNTLLLIAAMLTTLCISGLAGTPLSNAEVAEILGAHNAVRQRIARAESLRLGATVRIPDLIWDSTLATVAQEWANSLIKRNPPRGGHRKQEELQQLDLGENWYLAWWEGTPPDLSAKAVVESWAEEQKWYNYDDNFCAAGKECLHYTQLVWSNTERLGAGRAVRTTDDGRTYVIWVCNYAPAGNIKGQRPYSVTRGPAEP